jgi:hypothetical protein
MGAAALAGAAFSGVILAAKGFPDRYPPGIQAVLAAANDIERIRSHCFQSMTVAPEPLPLCRFGDATKTPSIALWGDSHSSALMPALDEAAHDAGRSGILLGRSRCPPLLDVMLTDARNDLCARFNRDALGVASGPSIRTVVLTARWAIYERGSGYGHDAYETRAMVDLAHRAPGEDQRALFEALLERSVRSLVAAGKQVVVVAPIPEAAVPLPDALARATIFHLGSAPSLPRADYLARDSEVLSVLRDLARRYPIRIVDPAAILCGPESCAYQKNGRSLYADYNHLSLLGAHTVAPIFAPVLPKASLGLHQKMLRGLNR